MESTLSSLCSRSDLPLTRQGAALAHLDSLPPYDLVLWTDGSVPFLFGKGALASLPTALSCALRPLFSFQQAQYVQVFLLKRATFCILFVGLGSTNKSAVSHFFSFYLTLALCSPLCPLLSFLLPKTLWQIWQKLPSLSCCSIRLQWVSGHLFLPENNAADDQARQGALLALCAIPCSLSSVISRINSCLFSDWRRAVSSTFDTQVSSIFTEERVLPRHARCVLSRLRWNGHSLLLSSYLSRIGRIKNPSCDACGHSFQDTSHLILHCPATDSLRRSLFGDSLASGAGPEQLPGFWGSMVYRHASISRKNNNNNRMMSSIDLIMDGVLTSVGLPGLSFFY